MATNSNLPWTDAELASAVEAYVFMLRIERAGLAYSKTSGAEVLLSNQLKTRNDASLRYRMRNISAVISELGGPVHSAYSPAERVGTNVRARIRKLLLAHAGFNQILREIETGPVSAPPTSLAPKSVALARLGALRAHIDELERELVGIGHNQPPEPLSAEGLQRSDFEVVREDLRALEIELAKESPDRDAASKYARTLIDFGLKVALWIGERATKFTDVALAVLAPVAVAQATGLTHELVETLKAVAMALSR